MSESEESPNEDLFIMRVKGGTDVRRLSSALYYNLEKYKIVTLRTLGAGPTQQAMKAIAIASGRMRTEGWDLICRSALHDVEGNDGQTLTALSVSCTKLPA